MWVSALLLVLCTACKSGTFEWFGMAVACDDCAVVTGVTATPALFSACNTYDADTFCREGAVIIIDVALSEPLTIDTSVGFPTLALTGGGTAIYDNSIP